MPMRVELRPIRIETGSPDEVGRLALIDGRLVALLVQLEESHGKDQGGWALEWMAGGVGASPSPFPDLDIARDWLARNAALADTAP